MVEATNKEETALAQLESEFQRWSKVYPASQKETPPYMNVVTQILLPASLAEFNPWSISTAHIIAEYLEKKAGGALEAWLKDQHSILEEEGKRVLAVRAEARRIIAKKKEVVASTG